MASRLMWSGGQRTDVHAVHVRSGAAGLTYLLRSAVDLSK